MHLLDIQREALRRASDKRLAQHMHRLDNVATQWGHGEDGYRNPRLDAAEAQRVVEVRQRALTAAEADAERARGRVARARPQPRSVGADTDKGA